jgi:hypothetical protein
MGSGAEKKDQKLFAAGTWGNPLPKNLIFC